MDYSLEETAARLGIRPTTLHQWNTQFATLLSDFACKELALKGLAVQRRFTADDIAVLQQAQLLLQRGHTYDKVRCELASQPSRQAIDTAAPAAALEYAADMASGPADSQIRGAQAGAGIDATLAAPPAVDRASQGLKARLGDTLRRLWLAQEAARGRARLWQERLPRPLPSRLSVGLAVCIIAILTGLSVVVVFEPPFAGNNTPRSATLPAAATSAMNSSLLPGEQSTAAPLPITPGAVLAAAPGATIALPTAAPPTLITASPTRTAAPSTTATQAAATSTPLPIPHTATLADQEGKTVRVRRAASIKAARLNLALAGGMQVKIIGGPVEADGYTWWQIEAAGRQGWCACTFAPQP
jgi:DNA-binding transcriptional MerR regulator